MLILSGQEFEAKVNELIAKLGKAASEGNVTEIMRLADENDELMKFHLASQKDEAKN